MSLYLDYPIPTPDAIEEYLLAFEQLVLNLHKSRNVTGHLCWLQRNEGHFGVIKGVATIAVVVAEEVSRKVDFEEYSDGVFAYDHLQSDDPATLLGAVWNFVSMARQDNLADAVRQFTNGWLHGAAESGRIALKAS